MTWSEAVTLINGIASSCALPFLIVAVLIMFRKPILDGLTSIELGSFKANFNSGKDVGTVAGIKDNAQSKVNWDRTGALFWFTSDTIDAHIQSISIGKIGDIVQLLDRSLNHARQLGLDVAIIETLTQLLDDARRSLESDWNKEHRQYAVSELRKVFNSVAKQAVDHENEVCKPGFKADPDGL